MLLRELIRKGTDAISQSYPEREAREMVFLFLELRLGTKRHTHILEPEFEVSDDVAEDALAAFGRMSSGEPLQYVTGKACFYDREYKVTPDVLIPRPETEVLCRQVVEAMTAGASPLQKRQCALKILDLCTGSGCIAWTLALEMPGASVTAADVSEDALAVASSQDFAEEMSRTGACGPMFRHADILKAPEILGLENGSFDVLVSNPPYVMLSEKARMRRNVLEHEPELALFVPDDDPLLFYRAVSDWALHFLKPGGLCMVEINEALGMETADVFVSAGFQDVRIVQDLNSRDRFVKAIKP